MPSEKLREAIELAKTGQNRKAKALFIALLKENPKEELAWLWVVDLIDIPREKITVLKRAIELNPESKMIQDALDHFTEVLNPPPPPVFDIHARYADETEPELHKGLRKWLRWVLILLISATIITTGFFSWPYLKNALDTPLAMLQNPTAMEQTAELATWTPQASATPTITPTPTPELPLAFGAALPEPAAQISIWDAEQLVPFAQWGDGSLLSANWINSSQISVISSRGFDQFDLNNEQSTHQVSDTNAIRLATVSASGNSQAWLSSDNEVCYSSSENSGPSTKLETMLEPIQKLQLSPDGSHLAIISDSNEIEIWHTESEQLLGEVTENYGQVESLGFSPDNSILAMGNQWGFVWFFDPKTGAEINKFYDQEGSIQSLTFSEDGRFLAAGSTAQDVVLFDMEAMTIHHHVFDLGQTITSIAFSPYTELLAIGLDNGEIILWDDTNRKIVDQYSRHRAAIRGLFFNPTGENLLSWAEDGALLSWQVTVNQRVDSFRPDIPGSIFTSAITPNGKLIALAGSDSQIHIFDLASQQEIATLKGHVGSVWYLDISPDGEKMVSGGRDGRVQLWSLVTFEQIAELGRHSSYVRGVTFSPDGVFVASASADEMIRVWDTSTLEEKFILVGHTDQVQSVNFSPDSSRLFSGADDGTIRVWNLNTGQMTDVIENEDLAPIYSVLTMSDGRTFLTGDSEGKLQNWNSSSLQRQATLTGHPTEINVVTLTADGSLAVSGDANGNLIVWQMNSLERLRILEQHTNPIVGLDFSNDARALYSVDRSGLVLRWDMSAMEPPIDVHQYTSPVTHAVISPNQKLAAFSSLDNSISVVDLTRGETLYQIKNLSSPISQITFSPASSHLAAGFENGDIHLWDSLEGYEELKLSNASFAVTSLLFEPTGRVIMVGRTNHSIERRDIRTGDILETMWGHSGRVESLAFAPNEITMASGAADGSIFIWDMDDNSILHRIPAHQDNVTDLEFSQDGTQLYSTSQDGSIKTWQITNAEELTHFETASSITTFDIFTNTDLLAFSGGEHQFCLWDSQQPAQQPCLSNQFGDIPAVSFNPDGQSLLIIDSDGCIQKMSVAESIVPEVLPTQQALPTVTNQAQSQEEQPQTSNSSTLKKLPAPLYFLSEESGSAQVWRLAADGMTKTQITAEETPITSFDVSRITDHLAYVTNNQLILTNKEGEDRLVLIEGEAFPRNDAIARLQKEIGMVLFSPDGWRIAYYQNGAHVYSILDNQDTTLIENSYSSSQNQWIYTPILFSPGGTNLYLQVETQTGYSLTVVNSRTGEIFAESEIGACCQPSLNNQQDAVFFTGRDRFGNAVGLWSIDIWYDVLTEILPIPSGSSGYQINAFPKQAADGTLYFFYAESDRSNHPALILASAASDGVSLLKVLRSDSYTKLTDVLWAENTDFVLISEPDTQDILYLKTDDTPPIVLPIQGTMMRWGE